MNKFAIALAAFVSLGLAIPALAEEQKDTKMPSEKMEGPPEKMEGYHHHHHHHHHHHYHHHMMVKPEPKPQ